MLVLGRKPGERIIIEVDGRRIEISPLDVNKWGQIKIGIKADKDVNIFREELEKK